MPDRVRHDELQHLRVAAGDMVRSGRAQPFAVTWAAMETRAEAHHRHAGRARGSHSGGSILEYQDLRRTDSKLARCVQVDVRKRLAPLDMLGGAEQTVSEMAGKPEPLERAAKPPGRAGRGDGLRDRRKRVEEGPHSGHGGHFPGAKLEGPLHIGPEVGRERASDLRFNDYGRVAPVEADIALGGLLRAGRMAELRQRFGEEAVGQDLAVDDDSVEVEDEPAEAQDRSPNRAVPTRTWVAPIATAVS